MELTTIASGSTGNCYILTAENGRKILLDCGVKLQTIITNKNFGWLRDYEFVYVSHSHKDHCKSMKELEHYGAKIVSYLDPVLKPTKMGQFIIKMFKIKHNVENYGIVIIDTLTKERFCYVTDFCELPQITGIDTLLMEVNYDLDIINDRIDKWGLDGLNSGFSNHFSLQQAEDWLVHNPTNIKNLIICHISKDNANREKILKTLTPLADNVRLA